MRGDNISVDSITEKILKRSGKPISTYELAKKAKISWSTANIHCYKLKSQGKIKGKLQTADVGAGKKMLWWVE